jgi:hypothetical protein
MRARALLLIAVASLPLSACAIPIGRTGQSLGRKTLAAKHERESVLVADDGARCQVGRDAFAKVQVGRRFTCLWDEAGDSGPGGLTPRGGGQTAIPAWWSR